MPVLVHRPVAPSSGYAIPRPYRGPTANARRAAVALLRVPLACTGLSRVPHSHDDTGVLLIQRSTRLRGHGGQWALPGGKLEAFESPWQAAKRELKEETGLNPNTVRWLGELGELSTGTGYVAHVFLGELTTLQTLEPDGSEAVALSALPWSWLTESDTHNHLPVDVIDGLHFAWTGPQGASPWPIPLWGATAFMLLELRRHLLPGAPELDWKPRLSIPAAQCP